MANNAKPVGEIRPFTQIDGLEELKLPDMKVGNYFIQLRFGVRSSKRIVWSEKEGIFYVTNCSDDSEQELTEEVMNTGTTNIGKAIINGNFYKEDD